MCTAHIAMKEEENHMKGCSYQSKSKHVNYRQAMTEMQNQNEGQMGDKLGVDNDRRCLFICLSPSRAPKALIMPLSQILMS